jgi:hypothetical protein
MIQENDMHKLSNFDEVKVGYNLVFALESNNSLVIKAYEELA